MDVHGAAEALVADGHRVWPAVLEFLSEFSGLNVTDDSGHRNVWIDAARASAGVDPEWARTYEELSECSLAPVGAYSHMTIFLGDDGVFYGRFDHEFGSLGASFHAVLERLLNSRSPVGLDMRVED
jgi:hypothetical protein